MCNEKFLNHRIHLCNWSVSDHQVPIVDFAATRVPSEYQQVNVPTGTSPIPCLQPEAPFSALARHVGDLVAEYSQRAFSTFPKEIATVGHSFHPDRCQYREHQDADERHAAEKPSREALNLNLSRFLVASGCGELDAWLV